MQNNKGVKDDAKFEIDRCKTVEFVIQNVNEHFPSATGNIQNFLAKNKGFFDNLYTHENITEELTKYARTTCYFCDAQTKNWHHKAKDSYILSLGEMKKVTMNVKFSANCNVLFYPELYQFGMVPVHNKANISFHPIYHINKKNQ